MNIFKMHTFNLLICFAIFTYTDTSEITPAEKYVHVKKERTP